MTRSQFSILIFVIVLGFVVVGRSQSYGGLGIAPIAPTVAGCPAGAVSTAMLCPVGSASTYAMYVSYNGGVYQPLVPPAPAGVTSVNGKTGTVTLTIQ